MQFEGFSTSVIHFSKLQGIKIYNKDHDLVGKVHDFFVDYEDIYPQVLAIQFKIKNNFYYIDWKNVEEFTPKKIVLGNEDDIRPGKTFPKLYHNKVITSMIANQFAGSTTVDYPALGKVILDRQIVDTSGKKVVRVNDIHFIKVGHNLRVTHAAIGLRSIVRRLGYEPVVDQLFKIFRSHSSYLTTDTVISWKNVHAIPDKSIQKDVKLNVSNEELTSLHPADLADILEDLDAHGREQIFNNLDPEVAAQTLTEVEDEEVLDSLLQTDKPQIVARILDNMSPDEAADILSDLPEEDVSKIISNMEDEEASEEIKELLEHEEDTAGGLMSTEVFQVTGDTKKPEILSYIKNNHEEISNIYDIFITDEKNKLIGTCSLQQILIANDEITIGEIMNHEDFRTVKPTAGWKEVAQLMSKYNLINVAVVDEQEELLGIVTVDDVLPWLLDEI